MSDEPQGIGPEPEPQVQVAEMQVEKVELASSEIPTSVWESAVAAWINDHLRNSPVSHTVEAWNHLHGVLPKLRDYLESELRKL